MILGRGTQTPQVGALTYFAKSFSENCMKRKEIGPTVVGASLSPPWYC